MLKVTVLLQLHERSQRRLTGFKQNQKKKRALSAPSVTPSISFFGVDSQFMFLLENDFPYDRLRERDKNLVF